MTAIRQLFFSIIAAPVYFMWCGFVLSKLWLWFVVPSFGFPVLTVVDAAGICLIVRFMKIYKLSDTKDDEFKRIRSAFIFPLIALSIGWFLRHA